MADLEEILFSNRRTVQFWADSGAVLPSPDSNHKGRGNHRAFDADEVVVALVVRAASQIQLPIGRLIMIADAVRNDWLKDAEKRGHLNRGIVGNAKLFAIIEGGNRLILVVDPSQEDAMSHPFADMTKTNHISNSWKGVIHLTPWLQRARSSLA